MSSEATERDGASLQGAGELEAAAKGSRLALQAPTWFGLILLALINMLNGIDRSMIGILIGPIQRDLAITDSQVGVLTGLAFSTCYALSALPIAWLADRMDRARILAIGISFWSLMTAASGAATSFFALVATRMGLAVGEASCSPASYALIGDYYPPDRRAAAMSMISVATGFGTLLAFALGGQIVKHFDWRVAFFAAAVPGLLLGLIAWFFLPEPRRAAKVERAPSGGLARALGDIGRLLARPAVATLILSACALQFTTTAISVWTALLLQRAFGWEVGGIGLALGVTFGLSAMISPILTSVLGDRFVRRNPGIYPSILACTSLAAAPLLLFGLFAKAGIVAVALIAGAYALTSCWPPLILSSMRLLVPGAQMASATALLGVVMNFFGGGLGALSVGLLGDELRGRFADDALRYALSPLALVYLIAACALVASAVLMRRAISQLA